MNTVNISKTKKEESVECRIRESIIREFDVEIEKRMKVIRSLEKHIFECQNNLKKLRYAIILSYYKSTTTLKKEDDSASRNDLEKTIASTPQIHPLFKRNENEAPVQDVKSSNAVSSEVTQKLQGEKVFNKPQQVPSLSSNKSHSNKKVKYLLVVGNTSKYIRPPNSGIKRQCQFQWIAYVQIKNCGVNANEILKAVQFRLHPSYKPNDVLQIAEPPFQIVKRGWGEFPLTVQLFFRDELMQKPITLVHNIVLDKTLSGLHTLGAETIFEIWLPATKKSLPRQVNQEDHLNDIESAAFKSEYNHEDFQSIQTIDESVASKGLQRTNADSFSESTTQTFAVNEQITPSYTEDQIQLEMMEVNHTNSSAGVSLKEHSSNSSECLQINKSEILADAAISTPSKESDKPEPSTDLGLTKSPISLLAASNKQDESEKKYFRNVNKRNIVFQKKGKLYIIDPLQVRYKRAQSNQVSLLKSNIPKPSIQLKKKVDLHKTKRNVLFDHDYIGNANRVPTKNSDLYQIDDSFENNNEMKGVFDCIIKSNIQNNMISTVDELLKKFPIIKPAKGTPHIRRFFMAESLDRFQNLSPIKQRVFEWLRARYLHKLIKAYLLVNGDKMKIKSKLWTTKEISKYARYKGCTPKIMGVNETRSGYIVLVKNGGYIDNSTLEQSSISLTPNTNIYKDLDDLFQKLKSIKAKYSDMSSVNVVGNFDHQRHINRNTNKLEEKDRLKMFLTSILNMESPCDNNSSQLIIAKCLSRLIEQLTMFAFCKQNENSEKSELYLSPQNVIQAIKRYVCLDFLTNNSLGSVNLENKDMIKQ